MWVLLVLVVCIAFAGLIGLKLFPVYLENIKIERGLTGMLEDPDTLEMDKKKFKEFLLRRLDIDSVTEVRHGNFWDLVTYTKEDGVITVDIVYDVLVPIAGNVSAFVEFEMTHSTAE
jgi:hypothetical protein